MPFPRDAGEKGPLFGVVAWSVQIRTLLSNGKRNETDGFVADIAQNLQHPEVSSGADSTITIVSLGRIERRNLALPRAWGRFSRIRNTNQPATTLPPVRNQPE